MSYIIQRRVKNAIYVYEGRSYRNKQGKPRNKQRYLGRLDEDGTLITRKRKLPAKIKEVKTVTRKFVLEPVISEAVKADMPFPEDNSINVKNDGKVSSTKHSEISIKYGHNFLESWRIHENKRYGIAVNVGRTGVCVSNVHKDTHNAVCTVPKV